MNNRIWRGSLLIGALTLLTFSSGCSRNKGNDKAKAEATAAPKIELPSKSFDFGTATEGDKLKHVFQIKNTGKGNLVLDRVTTSCGCTTAVIKNKEIAPGATGEIEVTFDTTARRGANRKSITVLSNDPSTPRAQLEVAVNVESLLAFDPFFVRLTPEYGEEQVREAWLVGKLVDQAKIAITEQADDKDVALELTEKTEGDKKVQGIKFKLKGKKVGYGSGRVVLSTGIEKPNQLVLRYSWNVKGNLKVLPAQVFFDDKRPGPKERTLKVSSSKPDFKVKDVLVQSGPFKAVLQKPDAGAEGGALEVRITMQEGATPKADAAGEIGKLVLVSNDPLEPKKEIPLKLASGRPMGAKGGMPGGPGGPMGPGGPGGPGMPPRRGPMGAPAETPAGP